MERDDLKLAEADTDTPAVADAEVAPQPATAPAWVSAAIPAVFVVLWSSAFIAAVIGTDAAPPLLLTFSRFAVAGVLLTIVALVTKSPWPKGRMLLHVIVVGLLMQAVQFGAFYTAIGAGLPGGVVALIQGFNPVLIALLAGFLLGEEITGRQWLGFAIGADGRRARRRRGAALLHQRHRAVLRRPARPERRHGLPEALHPGRGRPQRYRRALPRGRPGDGRDDPDPGGPQGHRLGRLRRGAGLDRADQLGRHVSCCCVFMLKKQDASRVGTLFFLTPAVTALLAWIVIGQTLSLSAVIGLVLGGAGVLLAARK